MFDQKTNKVSELLESKAYPALSESEKNVMSILLENAAKDAENVFKLNEGTVTGDIATFTPILLPLVRRTVPNLIANHLLGVQPMTMSTGYLSALVNT